MRFRVLSGMAIAIGALGVLAAPVSAGAYGSNLDLSVEVVDVGGSVTVSGDGCQVPTKGPGVPQTVDLTITAPDTTEADQQVLTDEDGAWSVVVGPLTQVGEYEITASCDPLEFDYAPATVEVLAQQGTTTTTTVPSTSTTASTPTTAAVAAAAATPSYTG